MTNYTKNLIICAAEAPGVKYFGWQTVFGFGRVYNTGYANFVEVQSVPLKVYVSCNTFSQLCPVVVPFV